MAPDGYCSTIMPRSKSSDKELRDELLNRELLDTLKEARALIENWRHEYNAIRPHSPPGYRTPVPESVLLPFAGTRLLDGLVARLYAWNSHYEWSHY